jgi:hypothetical protein
LFFLGRVPCKSLDIANLFWTFKHDSWRSDHPCRCSSNCSGQVLSLRWGSVCSGRDQILKTQIRQCFSQPAQASPSGHFGHTWCVQRLWRAFRWIEKYFAWTVWKEQVAILFWAPTPPHGNAGPQASVLMGKLKHLPPGASPDNDLFLAMFLVRLSPSMRELVGAGNHTTAAAMVRAADALWDARGGHDPTVVAATTQQSRSPAPNSGRRGDKRGGNARSKSRPPSRPDFYLISKPWQWHLQISQLLRP